MAQADRYSRKLARMVDLFRALKYKARHGGFLVSLSTGHFGSYWPAREAIWACPCKNLRSPDKAIMFSIGFGNSHRQNERYTYDDQATWTSSHILSTADRFPQGPSHHTYSAQLTAEPRSITSPAVALAIRATIQSVWLSVVTFPGSPS